MKNNFVPKINKVHILPLPSDILMALAASTTIFEKNSESLPINFEDIEVLAALIRHSSPKDSTVYVKCS